MDTGPGRLMVSLNGHVRKRWSLTAPRRSRGGRQDQFAAFEELLQVVGIDGLDQVVVEASLAGTALDALTLPPCISTSVRTSARPIPRPHCEALDSERSTCANRSKIRSSMSSGMPTPSSRMVTTTSEGW